MEKLFAAFHDVFPNLTQAELTPETLLADIDDWDSMNNVTLMLVLERDFGVSLADVEVTGKTQVAELIALLQERGAWSA